ncbi:peptide N-acetyl-beta-D-glucosaminyl asparaginase amidase A-domain-containing protein [Sparassis latifolia]
MLHIFQQLVAALFLAAVVRAQVLVDFQVAQPPPVPQDAQECTIEIVQRTFGNSYGDPEIVEYTPPADCGAVGSWAGITLNFTVTSNGTQYDRLGIFTFQNVEIWRTSTPEPTTDGIIWTYVKDVTRYTPLFAKPGTFILELDNLLETGLNGQYATTLYATFYASSVQYPPAAQANMIIPVTTLANNTGDDASVPPAFSLNVTVPQNAVQIYAELYASGNAEEEFWYYNVPSEYLDDLPADFTYGNGPFREVRMLVDGQLAGVAFPYAVIFTGGILPSAWRPITSYGALDLPTYYIDLTPFVPILADGSPHNITIDVASAETDHTINDNWYVSGNLQVVTDPSARPTTGRITSYSAEPYAVTTTSASMANGNINITVSATRKIAIEAEIVSGSGVTTYVAWSQSLEYSNTQYYMDDYNIQNVAQSASGSFLSTHNGVPTLVDDFSYPLYINITSLNPEGTEFTASFDHSYERTSHPSPFLLGSTINERQLAAGIFVETANGNYGNGTSNNTFSYLDTRGNTYDREVNAAYDNITYDHQGGSLYAGNVFSFPLFSLPAPMVAAPRLPGGRSIGV